MIGEHAPAKVNLALHVTGRRGDGYHTIETLAVFCETGDRLTFAPAGSDSLTIGGPFGEAIKNDRDNLVTRARDLLRSELRAKGADAPPVAIQLEKHLPVAAGIGGGSADAAAALRGLARLWGADSGVPEAIAPRLGADVPMCLHSRPLTAGGIGDEITAVACLPSLHLVLANPGVAVSTPAVFQALQTRSHPPMQAVSAFADIERLTAFLSAQRNDLEPPAMAVAPVISEALEALRDAGAALARMSGSGATCFGIWHDAEGADRAAKTLRRRFPGWYVRATRTHPAGDDA